MRGISTISISVTVAAGAFWALDFAGFWDSWGIPAGHDAAVFFAVAAVALWLTRRADRLYRSLRGEYRRREAVLIRTVDRLAGPPTQPMPRLP